MRGGRWAIQSTKTYNRLSDGQPVQSVHYFRRQLIGFFNEFAGPDEAMTWPRKQDAVGFMRRILGRRPGLDGYDVVNLAVSNVKEEVQQ